MYYHANSGLYCMQQYGRLKTDRHRDYDCRGLSSTLHTTGHPEIEVSRRLLHFARSITAWVRVRVGLGVMTSMDSIFVTDVDDGLNLPEFMFSENNNAAPADSPPVYRNIPSIFQHRPTLQDINSLSLVVRKFLPAVTLSINQPVCTLFIAALSVSVPDHLGLYTIEWIHF